MFDVACMSELTLAPSHVPDLYETMASMYRPRKRKRASCDTDSRVTKYLHVVTPTPDAGSDSTSSRNDLNVSADNGSSDSDDDSEVMGGRYRCWAKSNRTPGYSLAILMMWV